MPLTTIMSVTAVAVFTQKSVKGHVFFREHENRTYIRVQLSGFRPHSVHGFHIHEYGDLRDGCTSCCKHYNPFKKNHGGRHAKERHVGDLGNIVADADGKVDTVMYDRLVRLSGKHSVVGRSVVVHAGADDLGRAGTQESLQTGTAGARIACSVIGLAASSK